MKRLFVVFLIMFIGMAGIFAGDLSGETRGEVGYDTEAEAITHSVDAGAVYAAGSFTVGLDVLSETFEDFDVGLPIIADINGFKIKVEPGVNNILEVDSEIFTIDGGADFSLGPAALSFTAGYGSDEILSMKASATFADLIPNTTFDLKWFDGDDLGEGATGIIEFGATIKY